MMVYKLKVWGEDQNGSWKKEMTVTGDKLGKTIESFNELEGYEDYDCDHIHIPEPKASVINALQKLGEVMNELSQAWENVDDETNDILTADYPFHKDLNELRLDVLDWHIIAINKITK